MKDLVEELYGLKQELDKKNEELKISRSANQSLQQLNEELAELLHRKMSEHNDCLAALETSSLTKNQWKES